MTEEPYTDEELEVIRYEAQTIQIDRLLATIDRLRLERDALVDQEIERIAEEMYERAVREEADADEQLLSGYVWYDLNDGEREPWLEQAREEYVPPNVREP